MVRESSPFTKPRACLTKRLIASRPTISFRMASNTWRMDLAAHSSERKSLPGTICIKVTIPDKSRNAYSTTYISERLQVIRQFCLHHIQRYAMHVLLHCTSLYCTSFAGRCQNCVKENMALSRSGSNLKITLHFSFFFFSHWKSLQ